MIYVAKIVKVGLVVSCPFVVFLPLMCLCVLVIVILVPMNVLVVRWIMS